MIYHLSIWLKSYISGFNVVHYVSFRAIASLLSTLFFSFVFGDACIAISKKNFRSKTREMLPESHKKKDDTPTMGGVFILGVVVLNTLLWCNVFDPRVWFFLFCFVGFGAIGFWDDWCKVMHKKGIAAGMKFKLQWLVAAMVALGLIFFVDGATVLSFPFCKTLQLDISWLYVPWAMFVIVSTSNAVNLTDGLDGLAIGSLLPNFALFSLLAYLAGHHALASYLYIPFTGSAEIAVIGSILVGASLGFLWYNAYPAEIFMGDVGSLSLGAGLALMALMAKQEFLLVIAGGLFVLETVSVIAQVMSLRYLGRRCFKMAPIHHHFELLGWQESKITVRFGIISFILCLLALITLKLR
ncbi:MAG TPA: phospho-N-acetylmuramoyl-pentapeptide-transferase [Candidatus Babeliales bacterium]|nr:phospho-N-acetylmuramoyl-pentapeptide-transferase [Candidatus Babeliales bacterium]